MAGSSEGIIYILSAVKEFSKSIRNEVMKILEVKWSIYVEMWSGRNCGLFGQAEDQPFELD